MGVLRMLRRSAQSKRFKQEEQRKLKRGQQQPRGLSLLGNLFLQSTTEITHSETDELIGTTIDCRCCSDDESSSLSMPFEESPSSRRTPARAWRQTMDLIITPTAARDNDDNNEDWCEAYDSWASSLPPPPFEAADSADK